MAVVVEGKGSRIYLSPTPGVEEVSHQARLDFKPEIEMPKNPRWFSPPLYGLTTYGDLFTNRQLVALTTFCDLVNEARERIQTDASAAGFMHDDVLLRDGGKGARAYGDAVGVYLGLSASRQANRSSSLNFWDTKGANVQQVFARHALPMTWDFVEGNPLSNSTGNFTGQVKYLTRAITFSTLASPCGFACQKDAQHQTLSSAKVISTDPPYYDNIGYADLSDFFTSGFVSAFVQLIHLYLQH